MKQFRRVTLAALFSTFALASFASPAPAQTDLESGPLKAYQITADNRHLCWAYDCTFGPWCCMVYMA